MRMKGVCNAIPEETPDTAEELNPAEALSRRFDEMVQASRRVLDDSDERARRGVPGHGFFLPDGRVLSLDRPFGDSRYPLGFDGFNFWIYSSGMMHCNDGLFSVFLKPKEGADPNIAFFGGLRGKGAPVPLLSVPRTDAATERYQVFDGASSFHVVDADGIRYGVRVFVARDNAICFSLSASNRSESLRKCYLSSYLNPFMRHQIYESDEDRWFKQVEVFPNTGLSGFLASVDEDEDRFHSVTNYGTLQRGFCGSAGARLLGSEETASRNQYVGESKTLQRPHGVADECFGGDSGKPQLTATFVVDAIAGDRIDLELESGACARVDLVFRYTRNETLARKRVAALADPGQIDLDLQQVEREEIQRQEGINWQVSGGGGTLRPEAFNVFSRHLKNQVAFCSLIKGYVQLCENSLIGIRDVFQALEALSFWQPEVARHKMLEALGYTAPDGRCFRQYSCPSADGTPGRMDLRPFIDQGAWVISAISTYLKTSGDWKFLAAECGYHEIVDEPSGIVREAEVRDTVLDHLLRILDYLLSHLDPETRCIHALYGDWNDSLDGLGISQDPEKEFGTGVSVMATLQVFENLHAMAEMLGRVNRAKFAERIASYREAAERIANGLERYAVVESAEGKRQILHGWGDRRSYFVGSFRDPDGVPRDGLTSNAFWVLSGLWKQEDDPEKRASMKKTILDAFDRLDSKYGLKTFEPAFPRDIEGVGRIGKLPAGTAENGAAYIHATLFGIQALFGMGEPERAWQQLRKVLPFTELHRNLSHSPFVMPNSYGYNPGKQIDGQSMNDWQTGSSNVLMKVLVRNVFGFEPSFEEAWIQPAKYFPFGRFVFETEWADCRLVVEYENRGLGERRFEWDGEEAASVFDPILGTRKLLLSRKGLGRNARIRVVD